MSNPVLIVDDVLGVNAEARAQFCDLLDLVDMDVRKPERQHTTSLLARFSSGQISFGNKVQNNIEYILSTVREGWPFPDGSRWSMVFLDLRFASGTLIRGVPSGGEGDDLFGLQILYKLHKEMPDLPVVILSGADRDSVITECRKAGARDFMSRRFVANPSIARSEFRSKLFSFGLISDLDGNLIGQSVGLLSCLALARRSARGNGHVLLLGETGSGKELLARYIHKHSDRAASVYHVFHPFGVAEELQVDTLFGHRRGAFTGAIDDRPGLFELADGGVLFIDEIGDIGIQVQNQLLRPIESREVSRQGSAEIISINTKVILATNKELDEQVKRGEFKHDLLNRINAYEVFIPPLRERREDIPLLTQHLVEQLCKDNNARWPRVLSKDALYLLEEHHWRDGNIRELRNQLERAIRNNPDSELIIPEDLHIDKSSRSLGHPRNKSSASSKSDGREYANVTNDASPEDSSSITDLRKDWKNTRDTVAKLYAKALNQAVQFSSGSPYSNPNFMKVNLSGTVSRLLGYKLSTLQAADFVKRHLTFEPEVLEELFVDYPNVRKLYDASIKARPLRNIQKMQNTISSSSKGGKQIV